MLTNINIVCPRRHSLSLPSLTLPVLAVPIENAQEVSGATALTDPAVVQDDQVAPTADEVLEPGQGSRGGSVLRGDHQHGPGRGLQQIAVIRISNPGHESQALDCNEQGVETAVGRQRLGRSQNRRKRTDASLPEEGHLANRCIGAGQA